MWTYVICGYLILINLIALIIFGVDKKTGMADLRESASSVGPAGRQSGCAAGYVPVPSQNEALVFLRRNSTDPDSAGRGRLPALEVSMKPKSPSI